MFNICFNIFLDKEIVKLVINVKILMGVNFIIIFVNFIIVFVV